VLSAFAAVATSRRPGENHVQGAWNWPGLLIRIGITRSHRQRYPKKYRHRSGRHYCHPISRNSSAKPGGRRGLIQGGNPMSRGSSAGLHQPLVETPTMHNVDLLMGSSYAAWAVYTARFLRLHRPAQVAAGVFCCWIWFLWGV